MLKPLPNQLFIRKSEPSKVTEGGIIIPDSVKTKVCEGEIILTGPLDYRGLLPGHTILYNTNADTEYFEINDDHFTVVKEDDVLAYWR